MRLGCHVGKCGNMNRQRAIADSLGWTALQTNFGSVQSFSVPADLLVDRDEGKCDIFYSWHAPYVLTMNPKNRDSAAAFLWQIIELAEKWAIDCIVIHTGAVVGVPVEQVIDGIVGFIGEGRIEQRLKKTKIAIEFGASVCGTNLYPEVLTSALSSRYKRIGYCVDLAHVPAAGTSWIQLRNLIQGTPPLISHINYCGTTRSSSQDIHGVRHRPEIGRRKREMFIKSPETVERETEEYDSTIRLLRDLDIPMIIEGSSFNQCDIQEEYRTISSILEQQ